MLVPRRPAQGRMVFGFVLLSYVLAWGASFALLGEQIRTTLTTGSTPSSQPPQLLAVVMFVPLLAAVIARLVSGQSLRGTLGIARPPSHFLAAFAVPALIFVLFIGLVVGTGLGQWVRQGQLPLPIDYALAIVIGGAVGAVFGLGEEYGWRGLLLRELLSRGEARASVIIGVVWSLWHLPGLFAGLNYPGSDPWLATGVFTLSTVTVSYLYTLFFVATRGSAFLCGIFHAVSNVAVDGFTGHTSIAGEPLLTNGLGLVGAALFLVVGLVYRWRRGALSPDELVARTTPTLDGTRRDWLR